MIKEHKGLAFITIVSGCIPLLYVPVAITRNIFDLNWLMFASIPITFGVIMIITGIGMWHLKLWSWWAAIIIYGSNIVLCIYMVISGTYPPAIISGTFSAVLLYCLMKIRKDYYG